MQIRLHGQSYPQIFSERPEEQEEDLNMHFLSSASPAAIRDQELFLEQISEKDNNLESQL